MKVMDIINKVIGYLMAIGFVAVFMIYCSTRVGGFLLLAFILAPIVSIFYAFFLKNQITVEVNGRDSVIGKGGKTEFEIIVTNNSYVPTAPVFVNLYEDEKIEYVNRPQVFLVMPRKTERYNVQIIGHHSGGSIVGVSKVEIRDFLNIIHYEVKSDSRDTGSFVLGVVPVIAKVSEEENIIRQTLDKAFSESDGEDTIDETSNIFGGFPGYEYREYMPGDPLKRINSKLAMKRDELYVRLDEKTVMSEISVILDPCLEQKGKTILSEDTIEYALGIVQLFIQKDFSVGFYVRKEGRFSKFPVADMQGLNALSFYLADYMFESPSEYKDERFPLDGDFGKTNILYVTPYFGYDSKLVEIIGSCKKDSIESIGVFSVADAQGRMI